jgi:DNA helicase II / ATP-dependent DNA helicase PcrA
MSTFDDSEAFEAAAIPLSQRAMTSRAAPLLDDLNPHSARRC